MQNTENTEEKCVHSKSYELRGSLVDKMCGVVQCSFGVNITEGMPLRLNFKTNVYEGALLPSKLCYYNSTKVIKIF